MALVACAECKKEVSTEAATCPHCGAPTAKTVQGSKRAGSTLFVLLAASCLIMWWAWRSFSAHSATSDAAFCKENLSYYEAFCASDPSNCKEGARKLAKCE